MTRRPFPRRRRVCWYYRRDRLLHPRRWWRERCAHCGRRPFWDESMILMPGVGVFHDVCDQARHWRRVAGERLDVLEVVADVWNVDAVAVQNVMETRASDGLDPTADSAAARAKAWRVFHDAAHRSARLEGDPRP